MVEVYTTQPGIQLYTGYWIPELIVDGQKKFGSYSGVAMETQHYPDSINKPHFPPVILAPGQSFHEKNDLQIRIKIIRRASAPFFYGFLNTKICTFEFC